MPEIYRGSQVISLGFSPAGEKVITITDDSGVFYFLKNSEIEKASILVSFLKSQYGVEALISVPFDLKSSIARGRVVVLNIVETKKVGIMIPSTEYDPLVGKLKEMASSMSKTRSIP